MPFDELYTPTPARRRSLQLQFTPLTPVRESPRRLSISPPKLPFSNRTLGIGTIVFLIVSAVYKSGIIGLLIRWKNPDQITAPAIVESLEIVAANISAASASTTTSSLEVVALLTRVSQLEERQADNISKCKNQIQALDNEVLLLREKSQQCGRDLKESVKKQKKTAVECKETLNQLEVEQIQVIDKVEADLGSRLDNLLLVKEMEAAEFLSQINALKVENAALIKEAEMSAAETKLTFLQAVEKVRSEIQKERALLESAMDSRTENFDQNILWILSATVACLSLLCVYLWLSRPSMPQEPLLVTESVYTPSCCEVSAIEPADPEEQDRIALAVEDMRASIAREVHAQIEMIEIHHEREMSIMKAIVEETRKSSIEISSLMKEVVDETCAVSTAQNSPCSSSSCLDLSRDSPCDDISSLSVMLETGTTPIRVPLKDKLVANKPSPSAPTCYSIASPSKRLHQRVDSSSSCEWSEDENVSDKNNRVIMSKIWNNFSSKHP